MNKQLPGCVYIPFVSQSMRNYAVLHIVAEESRIFKTKERAPIMLAIEVYRPTEISLEKVPQAIDNDTVASGESADDIIRPNRPQNRQKS